jgi:taurine dioxygenase
MKVEPLSGAVGIEVTDITVQDCPDDKLADLLWQVERFAVVVLRRQSLGDRELHEWARRIGPLEESSRKVCLSPDYPAISYLSNLRDEHGEPIGFAGDTTDYWHSDQQHRERPATLALLYCVVPAPVGGATSFVSTDVDKTGLDAEFVAELAHLRAIYEPAYNHDNVPRVRVSHPALLVSPSSGKRCAYVSENTIAFAGLDPGRSAALKSDVLGCLTRPEAIYSHHWRAGDLILYDNAQLLHRREEFAGRRWLKGTKIFAPKDIFAVPVGSVAGE